MTTTQARRERRRKRRSGAESWCKLEDGRMEA
jgi:hypothetical protein